jgi:hypothetical protein
VPTGNSTHAGAFLQVDEMLKEAGIEADAQIKYADFVKTLLE